MLDHGLTLGPWRVRAIALDAVAALLLAAGALSAVAMAQSGPPSDPAVQQVVVGPNVNMVGGPASFDPTRDPALIGDPFLQRQNEPSIAVSSRNPCHLLGGANDYRAVELEEAFGEIGDAWLGVFTSLDCGFTWTSHLLPGHPIDVTAAGLASPIKGLAAGADPTVRAGTSGLFYYSGIAFNRGDGEVGKVFVARFIDNNNSESGDPIKYLGAAQIDVGNSGQFLDKPWIATDIPRSGSTCSVDGQTLPAGPVYLVYTSFVGGDNNQHTKILFSKSADCGATWSNPEKLSERVARNQGTSLAVDQATGAIYVAWREYKVPGDATTRDAILFAMSTDGGKNFTKAARVGPASYELTAFDQASSFATFRTNAYPTIAVVPAEADNRPAGQPGRVYLAWAHQGSPFSSPIFPEVEGEARIVYSTFIAGQQAWSAPLAVDDIGDGEGHQVMPSIAFAGGRLALAYYDLREDRSNLFEDLVFEGGLANYTFCKNLFDAFDIGGPAPPYPSVIACLEAQARLQGLTRHTIDVRAAMADSACLSRGECAFATMDVFSTRASRYVSRARGRLQHNPPNLPLFSKGRLPFVGDYIDLAGEQFLSDGQGGWRWNTGAGAGRPAPLFHVTWTDNRDVRRPSDADWGHFTPRTSLACAPGQAGIRNQNIYTAQLRPSVVLSAPVNAKRISGFQRTFVVLVQNTTTEDRVYKLTLQKPDGVLVSFNQYTLVESPVTQLTLIIPRRSTASRTVFVQSETGGPTGPLSVPITATDLGPVGGAGTPVGFDTVSLNPDFDNPDFDNPDFDNVGFLTPDFENPDFDNLNLRNPDFDNPDFDNPDFENPEFDNPDFDNPDFDNPDFDNPDFDNPDFDNPDFDNPDFDNPDFDNVAIADVTWKFTNPSANTTSAYNTNLTLSLPACTYVLQPGDDYGSLCPGGYRTGSASASCPLGEACLAVQFVARRLFPSPSYRILNGQCVAGARSHQNQALTNIYRYDPRANTGEGERNDETFHLSPGESGLITLRVYGEVGQGFFTNLFGTPGNVQGVTLTVAPQAANCAVCTGGACGSSDNVGENTECQPAQTEIFDKIPPLLTLPANITMEATSPAGATVTFAPTATDDVTSPLSPSCAPASGASFALGTTTVNCAAADAAGNTALGSFTVTVVDTTAPAFGDPPFSFPSPNPNGWYATEPVTGTVNVSDFTSVQIDCDDSVPGGTSVGGTTISVAGDGVHAIHCTATDQGGNSTGANALVQIDATPPAPPTFSFAPTPPSGWYTAPVVVAVAANDLSGAALACADNGAPLALAGGAFTLFSDGTHAVLCTATNAAGLTSSAAAVIVRLDQTGPVFNAGTVVDLTAEATGSGGAAVAFAPTASDAMSGGVTMACTFASGASFPLGTTTTVSCTATDAAGNATTASFGVTVADTTAPVLTLPANITQEATSAAGAAVTFTASASDAVDATPTVSCTPSSGSTFPLETTTVLCAASDDAGNTATGSFSVSVVDTTTPVLSLPATITAEATSAAGATVTFPSSATDAVDATPTVVCAPASGSTFPLGTTTVSCTASDDFGNTSSGSFNVTVVDTTAPSSITASVSPAVLWPPDGTIVPVTVSGTAIDGGSGVARLDWSVTDEYGAHQPSGSASVPGNGPFSFPVPLLRERKGSDKDGRHYTINVTAVDRSGTGKVLATPLAVNVHDQSGK